YFFFQAEDGIRDFHVTGVQTCALPILNAIIIPMHEHAFKRSQQNLSGPFAGVPFLVKDLFQEYAGYPTSYGCQGLKRIGYIAERSEERRVGKECELRRARDSSRKKQGS